MYVYFACDNAYNTQMYMSTIIIHVAGLVPMLMYMYMYSSYMYNVLLQCAIR